MLLLLLLLVVVVALLLLLLGLLPSLALALSALLVVMHLQLLLVYAAGAVHALPDWLPAASAQPGNAAGQRTDQLQLPHLRFLDSWPVNHPRCCCCCCWLL
jgi:hypothetical protein